MKKNRNSRRKERELREKEILRAKILALIETMDPSKTKFDMIMPGGEVQSFTLNIDRLKMLMGYRTVD